MIRTRTVFGAIAIAGLAFAAGRLSLSPGVESAALAKPLQLDEYTKKAEEMAQEKAAELLKPAQEMELPPEMKVYLEAGAPGEHHRLLDPLVGDWEGVVRIWMEPGGEPMEWPGTASREWTLDGRFVHERVESQSPFGPFRGFGAMGYNNLDGQYEFIWMENMSTGIMWATGHYDPDTKTLHSRGSYRDPATGKLVWSRGEIDMSRPNVNTFVGYAVGPDGREFKNMEGEFRRTK
jgi:hypothetical protein